MRILNRRKRYLLTAFGLIFALAAMLLNSSRFLPQALPQSTVQQITAAPVPSLRATFGLQNTLPEASNAAIFSVFENWASGVASRSNPTLTTDELAYGLALAQTRRVALSKLIENDPQQALEHSLPFSARQALPQAIQDQLEHQVDGRGEFRVAISTALDGQSTQTFRNATVNGKTYKAFVYGTRTTQPCTSNTALHGIAVGDSIALHESPIRVLAKGEIPNPKLPVLNEGLKCPVSGIVSREVAVDAGGVIIYLCCAGHIGPIEKKLADGETLVTAWGTLTSSSTAAATSGPLQSTYTTGVKNVILMRVDFSDATVASGDTTFNSSLVSGLNTFYTQGSYGATSFNLVGSGSDVTPIMRMPQTYAYYSGNNFYDQLRADAKAAAALLGYTIANYNWDITCMSSGSGGSFGGWSGLGYVGAPGAWVRSNSVGVSAHEVGHNYGLWHANYWSTTSDSIIGPGSNQEYGNQYDTMGSANAGAYQFNAYEKNVLQWLPDVDVTTVTANGKYNIQPFDNYTLSGSPYALKIRRDSTRNYWVDLRQLFTSNNWEMNGSEILWSPWAQSNGGSQLLDTTPSSPNGKNDAAVVVGRTFADTNAKVYITTVTKNTTPVSMDVVVNTGDFPGNNAPVVTLSSTLTTVATNTNVTLTANATDADGDGLAYYWEYGDGNYSVNNQPTETKSWSAAGEYRVRCTVSDMKGGSTSSSIVIKVGSPTTFRLSGTITVGGAPLVGVRVTDGSLVSYTDSDGTYTLVGETAGSKTIAASKFDYTFTAGFVNPVSVAGTMGNLNFTATQNTHQITGSVKDGTVGVASVVVSDGAHSTSTDASGNFTLTGLPNAYYTLSAIKPGYQFSAAAPVEILGADATQNFSRQLYSVSGTITSVTGAPVVDIGDGIHTATAYLQSGTTYGYNIQVPSGSWNLRATLAGFTISPSNFTNPLTVSGNLSTTNFSSVAGTTYTVSGNITAGSTPFPGVVVSAGAKSSTTDSVGNYTIPGLANGSYTVTPSYSGATFTPANTPVTIASANATGKNFVGTYPFTILTASPMPLGVINTAYNQTLSAVSGQTPFTWAISGGALPSGLALNSAGSIAGTPTASGTFNFTLQVTDNLGAVATKAIALTINPSLTVTTPNLTAPISSAYSSAMSAAGGLPPYLFWWVGSGSLPTGLSLNSTTGVLSGTPTVTGTYNFTVYVQDSVYTTANKALTMTITRVGIDTTSLPAGDVATPYSQALVASKGALPYAWTITTGTLPAGLTMSSAGVISGTPTAVATANFTVKVTDKGNVTATQALSITINSPLAITTTTLPRFDVGSAYSQTIFSTGGTAPVSWSITAGVTPVGMTLDSTGILSGTPTAPTTGTFTATATDLAGAVVSQDFIVTANLPLSISSTSPFRGTVGTPYAKPIEQIGGMPPFTWTLVSGQLPAGLTLTPSGLITGTPATVGSATFKVSVVDSTAGTSAATFTLDIVPPNVAPVVTSGIIPNPYQPGIGVNVTFVYGVSDTNGDTLTYAWDFGDGTTDTAASPVHAYSALGTYTVQATATDPGGLSVTSTLSLTVLEVTGSGLPPGTVQMTVSKVQGSAKFSGGGHDSVSFSGSIPNVPKGFTTLGKTLSVNYGGALATFTLDAKGKAHSNNGSVTLKFKSLKDKATKQLIFQGGTVGFQIKLTNGTWVTTWGMDPNATTTGTKVMTATIQLDGTLYGAVTNVKYSGKAKVGGKFKK